MSANDSTGRTLLVALVISVVCSIVISSAAVGLKPAQLANKALDKKKNILAAAGLLEPGKTVDQLFEKIETRVINIRTGEYLSAGNATEDWEEAIVVNPMDYEQRKAVKTPGEFYRLSGEEDLAKIRKQAKFATVYLVTNASDEVDTIILPVHGYGLWSTLYGFLALKSDTKTILGLGFYEHGETPGLGGEVDNPHWKAQWSGKIAYSSDYQPDIKVIKGVVNPANPDAKHEIDGLAGATLTSNGVQHLVNFWLGKEGFGPYLARLREEGK